MCTKAWSGEKFHGGCYGLDSIRSLVWLLPLLYLLMCLILITSLLLKSLLDYTNVIASVVVLAFFGLLGLFWFMGATMLPYGLVYSPSHFRIEA